jgi:hypothetical protein
MCAVNAYRYRYWDKYLYYVEFIHTVLQQISITTTRYANALKEIQCVKIIAAQDIRPDNQISFGDRYPAKYRI